MCCLVFSVSIHISLQDDFSVSIGSQPRMHHDCPRNDHMEIQSVAPRCWTQVMIQGMLVLFWLIPLPSDAFVLLL